MQTEVQRITSLPFLGESALGFGENGWQVGVYDRITLQLEGYTLPEALTMVVKQYGGLLGEGRLVFYHVDFNGPHPRGHLIFHPEEEENVST